MRRAHGPVLVSGKKPHRPGAHTQDPHTSDQRHIVKVHDIGLVAAIAVEKATQPAARKDRLAGLLNQDRLQTASPAVQRLEPHAILLRPVANCRTVARPQQSVRRRGMNHRDAMPAAHLRPRQALHMNPVAAEVEGRVERGDVDDGQPATGRRCV